MSKNRNKQRKQPLILGSDELIQKLQERINELTEVNEDVQPANIRNVRTIEEILTTDCNGNHISFR